MKKVRILIMFIPALLITMAIFSGCKKQQPEEKVCGVENPLTDLPWMKTMVDNITQNSEDGFNHHVRIYQCSYINGIGFFIEPCVGCPDAGYSFLDCEGNVLCGGGGLALTDNCSALNIDFANKKLIWEINQ